MFDSVEPALVISKSEYKSKARVLRAELLALQYQVKQHNKPVIIVIAGNDRSGRHETINTLCEWMDPRFLRVNAYGPSQHEDEAKPFFWRFWRDLPGAGEIAIYLRDWTSTSIVQYLNNEISEKKLLKRAKYSRAFESKQTDDGTAIIKCWLLISEDELKRRIASIRDTPYFDVKDELALKNYPHAIETFHKILEETSTVENKWHIVDGANNYWRNLQVGELIKQSLQDWLSKHPPTSKTTTDILTSNERPSINMPPSDATQRPDKKASKKKLQKLQSKLREYMYKLQQKDIPVVMVFEGWDAAGKGGAIRRVVAPLDAGFYRIIPIAKPTDEEYAHHYLWRFWQHLPRNGHMTIFDRSWYGRVLVERIEGFAEEHEWRRSYKEINDFEEQLTIHGTIVLKFWINISKDEQARRFEERQITDYKQHKITDEDFRNRERWDDYVTAIDDMIELTDTQEAPWTVISTDFKDQARIDVLEAVVKTIKKKLK